MTVTHSAVGAGGHTEAPDEAEQRSEREADLAVERLRESGIPSGLPAGLGDSLGTRMRGADAVTHGGLSWRVLLTSALGILVVLALAFVALHAMAATWDGSGVGPA